MEQSMTYENLRKKNKTNENEIITLKQNLKSLHNNLDRAEKHHLTHVALTECVDHILRQPAFIYIARNIFDKCKGILEARAGFVALIHHSGKYLEVLHLDKGGLPSTVDYDSLLPIRGFRKEVIQRKVPQFCNDFKKSKWWRLLPKGHVHLENVLFAPIVLDQVSVGLLGFANKKNDFDDDDIRIVSSFAKLAALSLSNSKAWQVMKEKKGNHKAA